MISDSAALSLCMFGAFVFGIITGLAVGLFIHVDATRGGNHVDPKPAWASDLPA